MAKPTPAHSELISAPAATQCLQAPPAIITRTHADTTVTLSHVQYRELADVCKAHAGKPLNLTSVEDIGDAWGQINYWGLPVFDDARLPNQKYQTQAYVYLVNRVNTTDFRRAGRMRPECDWSKLRNSEIFPFIVWHEIGHFRDNFHPFDLLRETGPEVEAIRGKLALINEVLADRFAWAHIRPGEAMPLTEQGKRNADAIERDIEMIGQVLTRAKHKLKPLETGQYRHIPAYMLSSKRKAAYVGPDIDPTLLAKEIKYHRDYFDQRGRYMEGVGL